MEYIRVTKENLEKEHICCAISNNKDMQVISKKALCFLRAQNAGNASLSIFLRRMHGIRSMLRGICI